MKRRTKILLVALAVLLVWRVPVATANTVKAAADSGSGFLDNAEVFITTLFS